MIDNFKKIKQYLPELAVSLLLFAAAMALYVQAVTFGFVDIEDDIIFTEHRLRLDAGGSILLESLRMPSMALQWIPVSNLVALVDVWLCGDNIGLLHLMNVSTHAMNTVMLFLIFRLATASRWPSALVAAIFALHPVNTEQVVSWCRGSGLVEAFFFMLTLLAYLYYARRPSFKRFVPVIACFTLGLLSRPAIIYLPLLLLLLDFWPLGRWRPGGADLEESRFAVTSPWKLVAEKAPLLMIAAAWTTVSIYLMFLAPVFPDSLTVSDNFSFLFNIPVVYVVYLWVLAAPFNLPFYFPDPMPPAFMLSLWQVLASSTGLLLISLAVIRAGKKYPFLVTGWFWFLIALLPSAMVCVIQHKIIIGRLGHLPMIGIFIMIAWGGARLLENTGHRKILLMVAAVLLLTVLATISWIQAGHWADRVSFFRYAVASRPDCERTRTNFGEVLREAGRGDEAVKQFEIALRLIPDYAEAHNYLALILIDRGESERALDHLRQAVESAPGYIQARNNLANLLADLGDPDGAVSHFQEALQIDPNQFRIHNNLAIVLLQKGDYDLAEQHLLQALAINPGYQTARDNLFKARQMIRQGGDRREGRQLF